MQLMCRWRSNLSLSSPTGIADHAELLYTS
jgi:hypothetical protein